MNGTIQYTIRPYDTIWMLAQVFNTTVDSIMELNAGINPRNLQIGHVITIRPGYQYRPYYPENGMEMNRNMNGRMNGPMNGPMNGGMNGSMNGGMNGSMGNQMNRPMNGGMNGSMGNQMNRPMNGGMNGSMGNQMNRPMNGGMNGSMGNKMNRPMNGGMNDSMGNQMYMNNMVSRDMSDLMTYLRMLWNQHVVWTSKAVTSMMYDLPNEEMVLQRLLRNPEDFANVLMAFYGEDEANEFAKLLKEHITIAAEVVQAAMDENQTAYDEAEQRWRDNAEQIAVYMAEMNPDWNQDDWEAMLGEHLDLLTEYVQNMLNENYEEAVSVYDDIEMQAMEMADMMAEGLYNQYYQ